MSFLLRIHECTWIQHEFLFYWAAPLNKIMYYWTLRQVHRAHVIFKRSLNITHSTYCSSCALCTLITGFPDTWHAERVLYVPQDCRNANMYGLWCFQLAIQPEYQVLGVFKVDVSSWICNTYHVTRVRLFENSHGKINLQCSWQLSKFSWIFDALSIGPQISWWLKLVLDWKHYFKYVISLIFRPHRIF